MGRIALSVAIVVGALVAIPEGARAADTADPTLALLAPVNGSMVAAPVTISGTAGDDVGVTEVRVEIYNRDLAGSTPWWNGSGWQTDRVFVLADIASLPDWSYSFSPPVAAALPYWVTARAYDAAGNRSSRPTTNFTIGDGEDPTLALLAPVNGSMVAAPVTISGTAGDDVGVTEVRVEIFDRVSTQWWNGSGWQAPRVYVLADISGLPGWSYSFSPPVAAALPYWVTARAYDAAGNRSVRLTTNFTVNSVPTDPSVAFVAPLIGETVGGVITIEVVAADPQDSPELLAVDVSTDGGISFASATYQAATGNHALSWDTTTSPNGAASLVAIVTDTSLNSTDATIGVSVDNASPTAYRDAVLASGPDVYWRLGETTGTAAVDIVSGVNGTYSGIPVFGQPGLVADADGAPAFDGVDDSVLVPNSSLINIGTRTLRTISLWLSADDVSSRRVLYEEGGITRGMSIYIDQGQLYLGAWNTVDDSSSDTPWAPAFLSAPIASGSLYNVVLVLDQPAARLEAYVNGASIGAAAGGTLHSHGSGIGIGAMNNAVVFHDGNSTAASGYFFDGVIDEVAIYNSVLNPTTINSLYLTGSALAVDPAVVFIVPSLGSIVAGTVDVEVAATDPQDAAVDLIVEVSTDGGASFTATTFNPANLHHNLTWDTTQAADGGTTLIARVTDTDGNITSQSRPVTVSNAGATAMIIAAGDISTCQNTNDSDTADLIDSIIAGTSLPVTVVPVGDLVYEQATLQEFNDCYDPTWGRHKAITQPVPGNHEYNTTNAAGYDAYFGAAAHGPDFYYRYELAGWEIYALNSNCSWIGGCADTAPQVQWLRSELEASTNACTMAFFHFPRFVAPTPVGHPLEFWKALYDNSGDVVVNAHAHYYAEALPQDWQGTLDPVNGIRQFISGSGGRSHYDPPDPQHPNIDVWNNTDYGVLVFELAAGSYTWHFISVDGVELFSGGADCN